MKLLTIREKALADMLEYCERVGAKHEVFGSLISDLQGGGDAWVSDLEKAYKIMRAPDGRPQVYLQPLSGKHIWVIA